MKKLILIYKKFWEEKKEYFENYLEWGKKIKEIACELLGEDVRVIIFGSIVKGEWTPVSDIDVLILSDRFSKSWEENRWIRTEIKKRIGPISPFQIHLATPEEFKTWWGNFIKADYLEI
uniref:Nucleotidyltransferase domain-containing protein n=1 Tax=Thermodesulfobacterium geofontis TaxID=1295609 RepID=A0A7V5XHX1_9BACT